MFKINKNKSLNYYRKINDILMNTYLPPDNKTKTTIFRKKNYIKKQYLDFYLKLKKKTKIKDEMTLKEVIFEISKELINKLLFIIKNISVKHYDIILLENFNFDDEKVYWYLRHIIYLISIIRNFKYDKESKWVKIFKNNNLKTEVNKIIFKIKISKLDINNWDLDNSYDYLLIIINYIIFLLKDFKFNKIEIKKICENLKKPNDFNYEDYKEISKVKRSKHNSYSRFMSDIINNHNADSYVNLNHSKLNFIKNFNKNNYKKNHNLIFNKNSNNGYLCPKISKNNIISNVDKPVKLNFFNTNNTLSSHNKKNKFNIIKIEKLFRMAKNSKKFLFNTQIDNLSKEIINFKDKLNNSALYYSCLRGNYEISVNLLKLGSNIYEKCENGNTPLHAIFKSNNLKLISEIMKLKPVLSEHFNNEGMSPLAFATKIVINQYKLGNLVCCKNK